MPNLGRLRYSEAFPSNGVPGSAGHKPRALVLIHAFPLNAEMWQPQLALAEHGWHVIAPHLRGMGPGGAMDPKAGTMHDYAGDVIDLLDGLHVKNAVIGGLSMGGYVALALFKIAPSYFSGMVLADTRSQADTAEGVEARKKALAVLESQGAAAVLEQMLPKLVGESSRQKQPTLVDRVRTIASSNSVNGVSSAITAMMTREDSTPLLSSVHCPTLIMVGAEDVLTPLESSRSMHEGIAGSELVVLPAVGHLSSFEEPEAFNDALVRFLDRHV